MLAGRLAGRNFSRQLPGGNLKDFMIRLQVLQLYRECLRAIQHIEPNAKRELRDWIREDFKRFKNESDPDKIKTLLSQGNAQLRTLLTTATLATK
ncbi:LYR motif-containing protein 2 [Kappamyces sp. JEL0829]|nr:LYR motif-containing protein 2 [Kappamyces sp. JEL0829]